MDRDDLIRTLLEIDEEASLSVGSLTTRPRVIIVGGAAFLLHDITPRKVTYDIDVYMADEAVRRIISLYPNVNGNVAAHTDQIPYNFEDRVAVLDIGSKTIEFATPSIEDLIVMKLYANRPADIQDMDGAARKEAIDWDLLDKLVYGADEAAASAISQRRYKEMIWAYEQMKERSGK